MTISPEAFAPEPYQFYVTVVATDLRGRNLRSYLTSSQSVVQAETDFSKGQYAIIGASNFKEVDELLSTFHANNIDAKWFDRLKIAENHINYIDQRIRPMPGSRVLDNNPKKV